MCNTGDCVTAKLTIIKMCINTNKDMNNFDFWFLVSGFWFRVLSFWIVGQ